MGAAAATGVRRLSGVYIFQPLEPAVLRPIVEKSIRRLKDQLRPHRIALDLSDDAYELIIRQGFHVELGARPLEQAVERLLAVPIARLLLEQIGSGQQRTLAVMRDGDALQFLWDDATRSLTDSH